MSQSRSRDQQTLVIFLLLWSVLFGGLVRVLPALGSDMPVNDGGLFYAMTQGIMTHHYALPEYASYNHAGIPFAYPPLALYLAAAASSFGSLLQVVRWMPPMVSILTIPLVFLLGREILKSDLKAGLAAAAFAFLPASYELTVTGGGLTRSLGLLFSILTLLFAYRLFHQGRLRYLFWTALSASLLVLSHPVAAMHTLISCLVFWAFWGRSRKSTIHAAGVGLLTAALTSPWWITVLSRHGTAPFVHAVQTGVNTFVFYLPLLRLNLGNELFLDLITLLAIFGFLVCFAKREFSLPVWTLAVFLVGRDAQTLAAIPVAFAASRGFLDVVSLGVVKTTADKFREFADSSLDRNFTRWLSESKVLKLLLSFFLIYSLFNAFAFSLTRNVKVTEPEKEAIEWIQAHIPAQSRFLILTFGDPLNTPFQEWFPALTDQINLTVAQGYEWLPGQQFSHRLEAYNRLQPCLTQDLECVETWVDEMGFAYDYVYVYRGYPGREDFPETEILFADGLLEDLSSSSGHSAVYQTDLISIFSHTSR